MEDARKRLVKIGLIQVNPNWEQTVTVEDRIGEMLLLAENALNDGADLVFMPEAYQYRAGAASHIPIKELVSKYAGDYKRECAELAKKYSAYVVPWDYELDAEGDMYNTSYILNRSGEEIGRYRKVHLTRREKEVLTPGIDFPVFDLDFGKLGIMICFDNYYVESARILALRGAELILYPLFGDTLKTEWEIKLKARAIDNSVFVAPCHIQSSPREAHFTYTGIVSPTGEVVGKVEEEGTYQVIEINLGQQVFTNTSAVRGTYEDIKQYLLKLRNPEAYPPLLKRYPEWEWIDIQHGKE